MTEEQHQTEGTSLPPETGGRQYDEKDEKNQREEQEKRDEKEEKDVSHQDALSRMMFALFLIAAGLVLLVQTQNPAILEPFEGLWNLFFLGIGAFSLLEALLRLLLPTYRRPVGGKIVTGIIFLALGLGGIIGIEFSGAIILIVLGVAILIGGLLRGRL